MNYLAQHNWMKLQGEQQFVTEEYVTVPNALWVIDERGDLWTLGFNMVQGPRGEYGFDVLRNGQSTGHYASRIEMRRGKVSIFTKDAYGRSGYLRWTGQSFV